MQYGYIVLPESRQELKELLDEAMYYHLEDLVTRIKDTMRSSNATEHISNIICVRSEEKAHEIAASERKVGDLELRVIFNNSLDRGCRITERLTVS